MLKRKVITLLIIMVALLGLYAWYVTGLFRSEAAKADRFEQNYIAAKGKSNSNTDYLTRSEFKRIFESEMDSIKAKIDGIKAKNVTSITKNTYKYERDDTIAYKLLENWEEFKSLYLLDQDIPWLNVSHSDSCLSFQGIVDLNSGSFLLQDRSFKTNLTTVDYWQRRKVNLLLFKPRWGRKETFRETLDRCNGTNIVERTNIINKKEWKELR